MKESQLKRIGMFSGIPMDGSAAPLQAGIVEFNPNDYKTVTPVGGSGSGIDQEEIFPGTSGTGAGKTLPTVNPSTPDVEPDGTPVPEPGSGTETPDPEQPGTDPGDGEELELVKEKPKKQQNDRQRKLVRLALLAGAAFIAYRLFFKRR